MDSSVFHNTTLNQVFVANGMNAELTYDQYNNWRMPLRIINIVIAVLAIIIAFASTVSEKMIGVEMIQAIQVVLFGQALLKSTPSSIAPLQTIRYASGFNEVQGISYRRVYTFSNSLSSIGLEKEFLLSFNLMYAIILAIGAVCLLFKIKQAFNLHQVSIETNENSRMKFEDKYAETTKIYNFIFERVFFVAVFMCMYLIIFALMIQMTSMEPEHTLMSN